jgi:pantoate--beta-alanine ligase
VSRGGTLVPTVARTRGELAGLLQGYRRRDETVALVPTMGYLHEGHLHLVDRAREAADRVIVSIFVNPLQFGPDEDLERYPRDLDRDVVLAGSRGVDGVFAPDQGVMYPGGEPSVRVDPGAGADCLCGAYRPGHFAGVLTVVAKLFGLVRPHVAHFGRKDYQQAVLIRRMVRDLELGVEIRTEALIREPDGLALSSRNANLGPEEREHALGLSRGLFTARDAFEAGEKDPGRMLARLEEVVRDHPGLRLQYAEVVDPESLESVGGLAAGQVVAVAGFVGETRLIDNVVLGEDRP